MVNKKKTKTLCRTIYNEYNNDLLATNERSAYTQDRCIQEYIQYSLNDQSGRPHLITCIPFTDTQADRNRNSRCDQHEEYINTMCLFTNLKFFAYSCVYAKPYSHEQFPTSPHIH